MLTQDSNSTKKDEKRVFRWEPYGQTRCLRRCLCNGPVLVGRANLINQVGDLTTSRQERSANYRAQRIYDRSSGVLRGWEAVR